MKVGMNDMRTSGCYGPVVNVWNRLPDHVVDVNSLKQSETKIIDKF